MHGWMMQGPESDDQRASKQPTILLTWQCGCPGFISLSHPLCTPTHRPRRHRRKQQDKTYPASLPPRRVIGHDAFSSSSSSNSSSSSSSEGRGWGGEQVSARSTTQKKKKSSCSPATSPCCRLPRRSSWTCTCLRSATPLLPLLPLLLLPCPPPPPPHPSVPLRLRRQQQQQEKQCQKRQHENTTPKALCAREYGRL